MYTLGVQVQLETVEVSRCREFLRRHRGCVESTELQVKGRDPTTTLKEHDQASVHLPRQPSEAEEEDQWDGEQWEQIIISVFICVLIDIVPKGKIMSFSGTCMIQQALVCSRQ